MHIKFWEDFLPKTKTTKPSKLPPIIDIWYEHILLLLAQNNLQHKQLC